jgi:hypothetical protein
MHETYRMMAQNRIDDRIREAAQWRLADEARAGTTHGRWPASLRAFVGGARLQRRAAAPAKPAATADACA